MSYWKDIQRATLRDEEESLYRTQNNDMLQKKEIDKNGCYHFDLPLDVKKGIIRLVKYDLPIFQWVQ